MTCTICKDSNNCKACRYEGAVRAKVESDPAFRDLIARIWRESPEPPEYMHPASLLDKAISFAGAAIQHVAHGCPTVSDEERARRLAICGACEHFDAGKCSKCGCAMRLKASWALEKCPLDPPRW